MGNRQTKIRFFTIADYNEEQSWLEEQHKNGLRLVKITAPCFFTFEECGSEEVSYRLEFNQTKVSDDYLQMYEDYGWEYIGECMNWRYFRKPVVEGTVEGENEIFSDDESRLNMIDRIVHTRLIPIIAALIPVIFLNIRSMLEEPGVWYDSARGVVNIVLIAILAADICLVLHCLRKFRKLKKNL
nr:DUF2812 domain-containing protein [uncultured Mogibacterium sp.]